MKALHCVMQDGQLSLHRLSLIRLWSICPPSGIAALAWQPDGNRLAAGCTDGSVMLLHVESGDVADKILVSSTAITGEVPDGLKADCVCDTMATDCRSKLRSGMLQSRPSSLQAQCCV